MEHRYMIIIFHQNKSSFSNSVQAGKKVTVKHYSSLRMLKTSLSMHWDCSAFRSPLLPLYRWHEWCMLVSGPSVVTPQHLQLGALFYLSVSQLVVFPYLFKRRSAVRRSCVSLTLRKMKDSHHGGYCTQHSNTQTSQTWDACSLETRTQTKGGRGRGKVTSYFCLLPQCSCYYFIPLP